MSDEQKVVEWEDFTQLIGGEYTVDTSLPYEEQLEAIKANAMRVRPSVVTELLEVQDAD